MCPDIVGRLNRKILLRALLTIVWLASIGGGMRILLAYENTAGRVAVVPKIFPAQAALTLAKDRPTLIMLAHPRCPCTRASMNELAKIMADLQGRVQAYVLFAAPPNSGADWNDTELWRAAAAIPEVIPVGDNDGRESRRFGATTSGHTLLYAPDGRLLFSGGITLTRGHEGTNAGESAIIALVKTQPADLASTPVFGCPLVGAEKLAAEILCRK